MFLFNKLFSINAISKRGYYLIIVASWVYTIIWLGALILIHYFWTAGLILKIMITIPFIVFTPAITDLFQTYEKYVLQFREQENDGS